jgi:hypothetical protein
VNLPAATRENILLGLCAAAIVLVYALLHDIYRPDNGDDAWSLSFIYNYRHQGIEYDRTFGCTDAFGGQNGVELFGKLQAGLYGPLMDAAGWRRGAAHWISTALMALAAAAWAGIAAHVTGSRRLGLYAAAAMLLLEPFFSAANQARPEALAFLFSSLALLAYLRNLPLLAGILAVAAVETHPMGAYAFVYLGAAVAGAGSRAAPPSGSGVAGAGSRAAPASSGSGAASGSGPPRPGGRALLLLAAGLLLGAAGYAALHGRHLGKLVAVVTANNPGSPGGYLGDYFFKTRYLRHLPELALIVAGAIVFLVRGGPRRYPFVAWLLAVTVLSLCVFRRPNFHYALYPYPAFVLVLLAAADTFGRAARAGSGSRAAPVTGSANGVAPDLRSPPAKQVPTPADFGGARWLMAGLLVLLLPQYALVYRVNRGFDFEARTRALQAAVPDDGTPVVGDPSSWFAFKERTFYAADYPPPAFDRLDLPAFYLVENTAFRTAPRYAALRADVERRFRSERMGPIEGHRDTFVIQRCTRRPADQAGEP